VFLAITVFAQRHQRMFLADRQTDGFAIARKKWFVWLVFNKTKYRYFMAGSPVKEGDANDKIMHTIHILYLHD